MENNLIDTRCIKSKGNIRFAFINLMVQKDFDLISVSDICREAKITRATFYHHYKDKYQLTLDIIVESCSPIHKRVYEMITTSKDKNDIKKIVEFLLESLADIFFMFKEIFKKVAIYQNNPIYIMVEEIAIKELNGFLNLIKSNYNFHIGLDLKVVTCFIIGGSIDLIISWSKKAEGTKEDFIKGYKGLINSLAFASNLIK